MAVSEEKMRIVINNYFKSECNVDTSIREAFEKGFKIGVKKGQLTSLGKETERKAGKWIGCKCNQCGGHAPFWSMSSTYYCSNYCPHCGAQMIGGEDDV